MNVIFLVVSLYFFLSFICYYGISFFYAFHTRTGHNRVLIWPDAKLVLLSFSLAGTDIVTHCTIFVVGVVVVVFVKKYLGFVYMHTGKNYILFIVLSKLFA